MTSATQLAEQVSVRAMLTGYPGAGKTGALACLADAGFKLRILDFDGNLEPLFKFCTREGLANIDVWQCEDKLRNTPKFMDTEGIPEAFNNANKALIRWKYKDPVTREEVDLGKSKDWGADTIVVIDSLTGMGRAAKRRAIAMMNRTPLNTRRSDWGLAMNDQEAFIEAVTSTANRHHVIVTAHLKMIGPEDVEKNDEEITKDLKEQVAGIVSTRLYPSALGRALPPTIGEHFPTLLVIETEIRGKNVRRVIRTVPRPELDIKVPTPDLPAELDISDGLITVFNALLSGGIEHCLEAVEPKKE